MAEWLRSGLQSRVHRFDSGRRLSASPSPGTITNATAAAGQITPRRLRRSGFRPFAATRTTRVRSLDALTRSPLLLAALAVAAVPAAAHGQTSHQHDLPIDKSEQFVDLKGCSPRRRECTARRADRAQRVGQGRCGRQPRPPAVRRHASSHAGSAGLVAVRRRNSNQSGRAQVKLFIVCMGNLAGCHPVRSASPGSAPATTAAETDVNWEQPGLDRGRLRQRALAACPGTPSATGVYPDPTLFPVRPSFAFEPSAGEMYTSDARLFSATGSGSRFGLQSRDWSFAFDTGANDVATNAVTSIRCLGTHVGAFGGHRHAWDVSYQRVPANVVVPARTREYDITVGCPKRNGSFGIVGVHSEFGGGRVTGSEPRGDVWAFRLSNRGANQSVFSLGVICLEKRLWSAAARCRHRRRSRRRWTTAVRRSASASPRARRHVRRALPRQVALRPQRLAADRSRQRRRHRRVRGHRADAVAGGRPEQVALHGRQRVGGGGNFSFRLVCLAPWTEGHAMVLSGVEDEQAQRRLRELRQRPVPGPGSASVAASRP